MINLIVNADDFGLTEGINRAIKEAHQGGILTSATLMANGFAFESAIDIATQNRCLGVGIHLNLTQGNSVASPARIPSLINDRGIFYRGVGGLIKADLAGRISRNELELEVRSQIEKVLENGLAPTHLDGHKHFHFWPSFFDIVIRLASEYRIPGIRLAPCPTRLIFSALVGGRSRRYQTLKQIVTGLAISALFRINLRSKYLTTIKRPDYLWGVAQTGFLDEVNLCRILENLKPAVNELICHPGYVDSVLMILPTRLIRQRELELRTLTSSPIHGKIKTKQIQLIHYGNI